MPSVKEVSPFFQRIVIAVAPVKWNPHFFFFFRIYEILSHTLFHNISGGN